MKDATQVLRQKRISVTQNRIRLLQSFLKSKAVFDYSELFVLLHDGMDRTSLFRNLNLFVQKKILRRIPCTDGRSRYTLALSKPQTADSQATAIIICCKCHKVSLVALELEPKLPPVIAVDFTMQHIVVEGLCKKCK